MSRIARVVVPGYAHHVTQRGNNKEIIFVDNSDRKKYMEWLKEYSEKHGVKIWAYCLMPNHVHFVAVPEESDSLAKTFAHLHNRYALYFNTKRRRSGHLWQGRFFSSILDGQYLYAAVRYVERNPVRANLVKKAPDYPWSSAKAHVFKENDSVLSYCPLVEEISDWSNFLMAEDDPGVVSDLRNATMNGRPAGNYDFITKMEGVLQRSFKVGPIGRPKKLVTDTNFLRKSHHRRIRAKKLVSVTNFV